MMKKGKIIAVIVAVGLIVIGCIASFSALAYVDFDFKRFNNFKYVSSTYDITDKFENIYISTDSPDVNLIKSKDNKCKVVCKETDKIYHNISVKNNTLTIEKYDNSLEWFDNIHIGFYWENTQIDVYLPENEYKALEISASSGNINVSNAFSFNHADITISSGDVNFMGEVRNDLSVSASSGDILVTGVKANNVNASVSSGDIRFVDSLVYNRITASATSGDITMKNSDADFLWLETTSGDTELLDCKTEYDMHIECTSGEIELNRCDAENFELLSTSGDITGTLLSDKIFFADTNSGNIDVPDSLSGGRCEVRTTSGDIEFRIIN